MTLRRLSILFPLVGIAVAAQSAPQQSSGELYSPQPLSAAAAPAGAPVVYVSDFDLDVVQRKPVRKPRTTRTSPPSRPTSTSRSPSGVPRTGPSPATEPTTSEKTESSDATDEETPTDQANTLVKAVSENIIRALTQAGFDARRLSGNAPLPQQGVRVTGVFAEADEQNRARRLLVGGEPAGGNLILYVGINNLYVGINNLKNPEQHLYELADPPAPDPRHGPVITVTSYAPAARYELSRDPSGEELQKLSRQIAADLSALVSANRLTLSQ